ncbi:hypothetical protein MBLNU457_1998t1 [Dothideomycetes sp. NU457]
MTPFGRHADHSVRLKPKGVRKARAKHAMDLSPLGKDQDDESNEANMLRKRFFALPGEIRNCIYRHLLVRPNKFDMYHDTMHCLRLDTALDQQGPAPTLMDLPNAIDGISDNCASCNGGLHFFPYVGRHDAPDFVPFVSPARSKWAPPQQNPFLCDKCYKNAVRPGTHPPMDLLPCLCTRRQNLELLLVNKEINREASAVFWDENTFAFESAEALVRFLKNISSETRDRVKHISFIPFQGNEGYDLDVYLAPPKSISRCWPLLKACRGLATLELSIDFLRTKKHVLDMRGIRVSQKVTFRTPASRRAVLGEEAYHIHALQVQFARLPPDAPVALMGLEGRDIPIYTELALNLPPQGEALRELVQYLRNGMSGPRIPKARRLRQLFRQAQLERSFD